jgi:hypothetical protein
MLEHSPCRLENFVLRVSNMCDWEDFIKSMEKTFRAYVEEGKRRGSVEGADFGGDIGSDRISFHFGDLGEFRQVLVIFDMQKLPKETEMDAAMMKLASLGDDEYRFADVPCDKQKKMERNNIPMHYLPENDVCVYHTTREPMTAILVEKFGSAKGISFRLTLKSVKKPSNPVDTGVHNAADSVHGKRLLEEDDSEEVIPRRRAKKQNFRTESLNQDD